MSLTPVRFMCAMRGARRTIAVHARRAPPTARPLARARAAHAAELRLQRAAGNQVTTRLIRRQTETREQRLRRQADTLVGAFSETVVNADAWGHDGVRFNVQHNGTELIPGFTMLGEGRARRTAAGTVTAAGIAAQYMRWYLEYVLMGGPGHYVFEFRRGPGGALDVGSWRRGAPPRPVTEAEELRALGIPDRREIYQEIFNESGRVLQEVGVQMAGFAVEELIWWVAGGVILRAGGAVLGRIPLIRRLVTARAYPTLIRGLERLGGEGEELTALLRRVGRGETLAGAEAARAEQLLVRLEAQLGAGGVRRALTLTREEMRAYLLRVWADTPLLARLSRARSLGGDALQREMVAILETFERETHVSVQFVDSGVVQAVRGEGNVASLRSRPGVLQIERQVLHDSARLRTEVQHELAYYFAGGPEGTPALPETYNALTLLELMIENGGHWPL